ncbi:MAG: hypothetical protein M0Z76_00960 [Gammaproteobacteria bacterium]|nr:hypothetical protein [Gammaproteobacteria bacterium]
MKQVWLVAGLMAGVALGGCGTFDGGRSQCAAPAYVVPSPLPPLTIPSGLSAPADHSRYQINGAMLPQSAVAPAPGTRREARPPQGPVRPLLSEPPPAQVPPGIAGPPLSSSQSAVSGNGSGS